MPTVTYPSRQSAYALVALAVVSMATLSGLVNLQSAQDDKPRFDARDAWQRPEVVMDKLGIKQGSVVADVGCGSGYFIFHFAARVGAEGKVFAEDISSDVLEKIQARAHQEHLGQIQVIQGTPDDPYLPAEKLDSILVMNAYHEMKNYNGMLQRMYHALKPDGILGIIDHEAEPGQPRTDYQEQHRIPEAMVREDLARNEFHFLRTEPGFLSADTHKKFYFLVFEKANSPGQPH